MIIGIITLIILFRFTPEYSLVMFKQAITNTSSLNVILVMYLITILQKLMEQKKAFNKAQKHIFNLFSNNRIATIIGPIFMGALPVSSAIYMASSMVDNSVKDKLSNSEKAFIASYYRHIFEAILPTYPSVIIAFTLANIKPTYFIIAMIPMILIQILIGYFIYLKKIPKVKHHNNIDKMKEIKALCQHLYPIIIILILILIFQINIIYASLLIIILYIFIEKIPYHNYYEAIIKGFEFKILATMMLIFIFKDFVNGTDINNVLPTLINNSIINPLIIFIILIILSTFLLGNSPTHTILIPLAISTLHTNPLAIAVIVNCISCATMQTSPSHICLYLASEYFKIELSQLIKKALIPVLLLIICAIIYYSLLIIIL
jgi:integral membrane protein (TIGR00529 family)